VECDFDKAMHHYKESIKVFPYDLNVRMKIAGIFLATKKYEECIQANLRAIWIGYENGGTVSQLAIAYIRAGKAYKELGEYASAEKCFMRSLGKEFTSQACSLMVKVRQLMNAEKRKCGASNSKEKELKKEAISLMHDGK